MFVTSRLAGRLIDVGTPEEAAYGPYVGLLHFAMRCMSTRWRSGSEVENRQVFFPVGSPHSRSDLESAYDSPAYLQSAPNAGATVV